MPTRTISLRVEAYERLRQARRFPGESFSEVVLRATWPEQTITAGELLDLCAAHGPYLTEDALNRIEEHVSSRQPPEDKWQTG